MDLFDVAEADKSLLLVLRGRFHFPWWPPGAWVVYGGFRIRPDGRTEPLSDEELTESW